MIMIGYVLLFLSFFQTSPNCGCEDKPQIHVLAVVNGIKITKDHLSIDTRTQVSILQESVIEERSHAVNGLITKTLLEAEAKRRGLTPDKLYDVEVIAKIIPPTDEEVRAFYHQKRMNQDFKSVKNDIITQLKKEREGERVMMFANSLRVGAQVSVSEEPVTPPHTEADLDRVFATLNGVNITSRDIEESLFPLIFRVQKQVYALRKQDVDLRINDLLLEQEAKRLGTTPQDLLNQNVRSKIMMATEEQARAFYNQNKATLPGDFADHKVQIMQHLLAQELQKQVAAYAEQLRKNAAVQIYLTAPEPPNLRQLCCNPVD
jgi:hypothetical protein